MNITVSFIDNTIVVDGVPAFPNEPLQKAENNWLLIHWIGDRGWIEVVAGDNQWFTDPEFLDVYVTQHEKIIQAETARIAAIKAQIAAEEKAREEAAIAAAAAAAALAEATASS